MSFGWLRRLVGGKNPEESRGGTATLAARRPPTRSPDRTDRRPVVRAETSLAYMPDAENPATAKAMAGSDTTIAFIDDAVPFVPPIAEPSAELAAQLAALEAVADTPDARELLELLSENVDVVIRQLPAAARASLALCDNPDLTVRQLADKLSSDPALVQALLRTANSAAFGAGKESAITIASALDRIGIGGARAIIFANAVDCVLSRPGGEFNEMVTAVWNHMVATAPLARALAPCFGVDPEEAFAIALLHDVGKLVIFDRLSVLRADQRRDAKLSTGFVRDLLNDLHEPLGAAALRSWSMGERAARAIGAHHRRLADNQAHPLAEVVFVAERAEHAVRRGVPLELNRLWFDGRITADATLVRDVLVGRDVPIK